jgi:2,3,4,5-tetrahydropyridine-2-carboxylate N-succinyltransferase
MVTKMDSEQLKKIIENNWKKIDEINTQTKGELPDAINEIINLLNKGKIRVAEKINNEWIVNQWIKQAILLSFKINEMENLSGPYSSWYDKAHLLKGKTSGWTKEDHVKAGFRMVPNSPVRNGSFIGKNAVLMPCYVNIGAYIGEGTMIDTFARAGSCCQIGKNCHISAGSGVGGVLEPAQALPTIIEDNVFLGAMSEVVEGVIVGEGSVLSMGMYIGQSTKIVNRNTGEINYGKIPPYSVIVPGSLPDKKNPSAPSLYCAVIIKQVDEKTRSKTSINDLLRE